MKNYGMIHTITKCLCLLTAMVGMAGCAHEDTSGCATSFSIIVKAYGENNVELSSAEVNDVILYIFDEERLFVEEIETQLGTRVEVEAPTGDEIHVIAWGNLLGGNQSRCNMFAGDHISTAYITLNAATSADMHCNPDDLFFGVNTAKKEDRASDVLIPMLRKTGSMNVTILKLKEATGYDDENFSLVVRETYNQFDVSGNVTGNRVAAYAQSGSFEYSQSLAQEAFLVSDFNLIPDLTGIAIDIYHGADLLHTVDAHSGNSPILVEEGKLTNVLIDLSGNVNVQMTMTPWGQRQVWKVFGSR